MSDNEVLNRYKRLLAKVSSDFSIPLFERMDKEEELLRLIREVELESRCHSLPRSEKESYNDRLH